MDARTKFAASSVCGTAPAPACTLVIFGAGGDLTKRLLMPSLYNLTAARLLPEGFGVIGLQQRVPTDRVAGVATGLDDVERGAEVDDRVAGPLSPRHPRIHTRLGLLGRARGHLLGRRRRGAVEHEELGHRRRSSRRVSILVLASAYLGVGLNIRVAP